MPDPFRSSRDVIIRTSKFEDALHFYSNVLKLPGGFETPLLARFETGAFRLFVERGEDSGPVFELLVPDVSLAKEALLANGGRVIEEDPAVPRCYIEDPFGLTYNLRTA